MNMDTEMKKISVIVPFYGVEKYIEQCVKSLMEQTLTEGVEYIFINDASIDHSLEILSSTLEKYPDRKNQVVVIEHLQNKGLPAARNTGLSVAKGEYVYHCDSDDYVEKDLLENLYLAAKNNNADIVWCDYTEVFHDGCRIKHQPQYKSSIEALKGMLTGKMEYNVWNKLVKRNLYINNQIVFPSGYPMGEDLTMLMLFAHASKIASVSKSLYYYNRINPGALTFSMSEEKQRALHHNVKRVEDYLILKYGDKLNLELASLKLNLKWPLLISGSRFENYRKWNKWFPEANNYIEVQKVSFRVKLLELCALKKFYWVIWVHYWVVCKGYYSLKYNKTGK